MCHCVTSTVLKFVQIKCPAYMNKVFRPIENIRINTRNSYFKPSFSKNQYRTRRLILEILKETKNLSTFKHKMKHYYLNDFYNPNLWSITGFDYVLAIIEYFSFHFHFLFFFSFFFPASLWLKDHNPQWKKGNSPVLCCPCHTIFLLTNIAININIFCLLLIFYSLLFYFVIIWQIKLT